MPRMAHARVTRDSSAPTQAFYANIVSLHHATQAAGMLFLHIAAIYVRTNDNGEVIMSNVGVGIPVFISG